MVTNGKVGVRPAMEGDLSAVNDVYNQYVTETHYTFDVEPMTVDARHEWFTHYGVAGRYRVMVAVSEGIVIGYASSSRFRAKPAYETSIETSVYLTPASVGRGAPSPLYEALFRPLAREDVHLPH